MSCRRHGCAGGVAAGHRLGPTGTVSYDVTATAFTYVLNVNIDTSSRTRSRPGTGAITVVPGVPAKSLAAAMHGAKARQAWTRLEGGPGCDRLRPGPQVHPASPSRAGLRAYGLSRSAPVMNSTAAAAIFSGRRASGRSARGRTSSCHRSRGRLTQRQRCPADERTGGGTRPHPAPGLPPRHRAPRPRRRAPRHPAATTRSIQPTLVPLGAATARPIPARQTCGQDARRQPARDPLLPHRRRRPAGRHRFAVLCSRIPLWTPRAARVHRNRQGPQTTDRSVSMEFHRSQAVADGHAWWPPAWTR